MPKLTHLALQLLDPGLLGTCLAWPFAAIVLDLPGPNAKAVRRTTQFTRDRCQRRSFALILIAVFFFCVCSITGNSLRDLPSGKPGAVQFPGSAVLPELSSWR